MRRISIAGHSFEFAAAKLVAYHCASDEADWNLELVREGESRWLSGTITPGPRTPADLDGAAVRLDPRSLDELAECLTGRIVTLYPREEEALKSRLVRTADGVKFSFALEADWDPELASFAAPGVIAVEIEIEAEVGGLHPGRLPDPEA